MEGGWGRERERQKRRIREHLGTGAGDDELLARGIALQRGLGKDSESASLVIDSLDGLALLPHNHAGASKGNDNN